MAGRRRGGFAFDLFQPLKKGVLLKQGAVHTAFKYRFFVLYPGFFVYYEKESKWRHDLTKGETLDSRIGAIKLIGGTCNTARNAPKGCKFGFTIHAPDPLNKRPVYLINATSKQDRDEWIDAIRKATPSLGQHKRASSPQPYSEESRSSFPPPYSASASSVPPAPPFVEKGRDIGTEFNPMSYRDDRNAVSTPSRVMEEQRRQVPTPIEPPKAPVRQYPAASAATPPINSALSMPPPALPWQLQQQHVPTEVKKPQQAPARPKPPVRQFPAEIAAIMDKGASKSAEPKKRDGEQWIKELRKSTTSKPTTKPVNGGYPGAISSSDFKQVRDGWAKSASKPPPSMGSSGRTTDIKKKPLPPPPPPLPPDPSSVYVNIDDIEDDDVDSSSDEDSPQPPPYVPRAGRILHWAPDIKTPVNFEALGRQMNASQRFYEKKGFLYKMADKRKSWNLRYLVLRPGVFTYAKSPQSKVSGVVKLKNLQIFYPGAGERKTSYQFIVHTESTWNKKPDWTFAAQTEQEMKDWIIAFKLGGQNTT